MDVVPLIVAILDMDVTAEREGEGAEERDGHRGTVGHEMQEGTTYLVETRIEGSLSERRLPREVVVALGEVLRAARMQTRYKVMLSGDGGVVGY